MKARSRWLPWIAAAVLSAAGPARADDAGVGDVSAALARVEASGKVDDAPLTEADLPALRARLDDALRRATDGGMADALNLARKASGPRYWADDFDLLGALVTARAATPTADYSTLIELEAILGELQRIATTPALTAMVEASGAHRGQLRFEVARRVRSVGDRALPTLILAKGRGPLDQRKWAGLQLEAMGKRVAGDAVQTKSDDVLVEVLGAFGTVQDRDALPVTLALTSSERKRIRDAARASVLTYDKVARPKLVEVYGNLAGRAPADDASSETIARLLFALQDKQRMADLDALVDLGLQRQSAGDSAGAVEQFDRALAREPALDRRKEMVPAFVARGDALAASDPLGARQAYEEALVLDPDTPRKGMIRGALALLDAAALRAKGLPARGEYERALEADPGNATARTALDDLDGERDERRARGTHYAEASAAGLALVCAMVMFGLRGKRATR